MSLNDFVAWVQIKPPAHEDIKTFEGLGTDAQGDTYYKRPDGRQIRLVPGLGWQILRVQGAEDA